MNAFGNQQISAIDVVKKSITAQDVKVVAQGATNDDSIRILDYSVNPYSSELLGGLGSHWNLRVTTKSTNKNSTDTLNFFLKSVPFNSSQLMSDFIKESRICEEESAFFEKIYPILTENFKGQKWAPACYLVKKDTIVMEDLRLQRYKVSEWFFNEPCLKSALTTLARFHSCSILAETRLKKPLNEHFPDSFKEKSFASEGFPRAWHVSSMNVVAAIAENLGRDSDKLRKSFELVYDLLKPSSTHRNVICHSDLWPNNMMFDDEFRCVLLDFQTIRYAPLALDILSLLYLNTTREHREKNESQLITHYHSVLEESIKNNDTTKKAKIPSLEEVLTAYNDLRLMGPVLTCFYFPLHLIDKEIVKEHLYKRSESFENFAVGDRVEVTFAAMKKDPSFKNKIEQAVIEFSEICDGLQHLSIDSKIQDLDSLVNNIISMKDVEKVAKHVTNDHNIKILDYSLDSFSSEPLGYFGSHWQLNISIQKNDNHDLETIKLFVKSLPVDNQGHTDFVRQSGVFDEESFFYNEMLPQLTLNYKGEKWLPSCYLAKKEAIVLEDLRELGYIQHKNIDEVELMKSTLATVARFHSCSIVTEARLSRQLKRKIKLNEYYPNSFIEKTYSREIKTWGYINAGIKVAAAVAERLGYDPKKIYDTSVQISEMVKPSKKHRNILCHGDLWANNLMYDEAKKCMLIDFQFIRYTPLVLDLLQLFYIDSSRTFREKYEKELIEFYFTVLRDAVKSNDVDVDIITLKEIVEAYEDLRIFGVILASLHFPISLLDPNISKEQTSDSEGYENFIFVDRTKVTLDYMEKDESFKNKVEEVVAELAEVAKKL